MVLVLGGASAGDGAGGESAQSTGPERPAG